MSASDKKLVSVLLPLPLDKAFSYRLPEGVPDLPAGHFVRVPFQNRMYTGITWGETPAYKAGVKYKVIAEIYDYPPLDDALLGYLDFLSRYYVTPPGLALKLALSGAGNDITSMEPRTRLHYRLGAPDNSKDYPKLTAKQKSVVDILSETPSLPMPELRQLTGVGEGVIKNLVKKNILSSQAMEVQTHHAALKAYKKIAPPELTSVQGQVLQDLSRHIGKGFSVHCLHGVTGSGKSEVYFHLIESALAEGKNVLVLLPEIALTKQWQKQFMQRFDEPPHLWHSALTQVARKRVWQGVAKRQVRFLVGARSALALPLDNIGLIVVDEEHDSGYKQEDNANYHARDMAVVRAKLCDCPILLASATMSLETYHNIREGKYTEYRLPDRIGSGGFADVSVVNLIGSDLPHNRWVSEPLRQAVEEAIKAGKQSLLYLNRRGYAPMTLCRACGHRLQCPQCSVWLVEHRRRGYWLCHHCDYRVDLQDTCPQCETTGDLTACGPGVERLAEEVRVLFPTARIAEMTSDSMRSVTEIEAFIDAMGQGAIDIIIGTQLIAKGYHFPQLTVVGVIDADMGLSGGDLRANERTFQLLQQVSGRAGRGADKGHVFLQTTQPENLVIRAIAEGATEDFYAAEWASRKAFGMPPCGRLASVIISADDNDAAYRAAKNYAAEAHKNRPQGIEVLGPIAAPLAVLRGRYRYRVLIKCPADKHPQGFLKFMQSHSGDNTGGVAFRIDVDPINFY